MQKKEKYVFSTDFKLSCENLGIPESRHDEIFEIAKEVVIRALFFDKAIDTKSKAMEIFINKVQPQSIVEAFWFGCIFNDVWTQAEIFGERIEKTLSGFGG